MKPHPTDMLGDAPDRKVGIGYAGHPGMGPAGETCGSCHYCRANGYMRKYYKCRHPLGTVTASVASDIRKRTLACEYWTAPNGEQQEQP